MTFKPVPKPNHKRRVPKQRERNNFSKAVMRQIYERDSGLCQLCYRQGNEVHHVKFKSQGGRGVAENGILLCHQCHTKVHRDYELAEQLRQRKVNKYGEDYYKDDYDD